MSDKDSVVSSAQEDELQEEEYVVEKVCAKRMNKGKKEYFLKWKGYDSDENTWEPSDNLDCAELIAAFEAEEKAKEEKKKADKQQEKAAGEKKTTSRQATTANNKSATNNSKSTTKRKRTIADSDTDVEAAQPSDTDSDKSKQSIAKAKKSKPTQRRGRAVISSDDEDEVNKTESDGETEPAVSSKPKETRNRVAKEKSAGAAVTEKLAASSSKTPAADKLQDKIADAENTEHRSSNGKSKDLMDNGLEPEKIIGATMVSGDLMFLIKWKNMSKADLISAKIARVACPQTVINFLEERLTWDENKSTPRIECGS